MSVSPRRLRPSNVRASQEAAIALYESEGFVRWGTHPEYARVRGNVVQGYFYYKRIHK